MRRTKSIVVSSLLIVSALALAACSDGSSGMMDGKGQVRLVMTSSGGATVASATGGSLSSPTDIPGAPRLAGTAEMACDRPDVSLQSANVTFSSILARTLEGKLIDVTIDLPVTVDMMSLVSGREATLPIGFLPPGTYDQIVVVMTQVELVLLNGTKIAVTPPGGGWTAIIPVAEPFTVIEGQTTTVKIRFRRDLSFGCGDGGWVFRPRFECDRDNDD